MIIMVMVGSFTSLKDFCEVQWLTHHEHCFMEHALDPDQQFHLKLIYTAL